MFRIGGLYKDSEGNTFECLESVYFGSNRFILLCVDYSSDEEGLYPDEHHDGFTIMVSNDRLKDGTFRFYVNMDEELEVL